MHSSPCRNHLNLRNNCEKAFIYLVCLPTTTVYPSHASSACDLVKEKKHHPLPCSMAFFVCGARFYTIIVSFIN